MRDQKREKAAAGALDLMAAQRRLKRMPRKARVEFPGAVYHLLDREGDIANAFSTISYAYDSAGQVQVEGTSVTGGGGTKAMAYCRYPNGEVSQITYPNGSTVVNRNYTARGQLSSVGWGSGATSYVYLPDGKVDYQPFTNGVVTRYGYDGRGMIQSVSHKNAGGQNLAYREYWRDDRDRILAWKRGPMGGPNGMEDGRGDRYDYDQEGQLELADYRALNPETTTPGEPKRRDRFHYDQLGNRMGSNNLIASRGPDEMSFSRENNGLNQYVSWTGMPINYDDDMGPAWGAPEHANGVTMQEGWITASFNALNQPMGIWSPVYGEGETAQYMWFGYDPLGRCVKRWMGNDQRIPVGPNATTYYYYDGWNLVQEGPGDSTVDRTYVHGGRVDEVVASRAGGVWVYHHYDARGHCILLTKASDGSIREQYDYDAFGFPYFYKPDGNKLIPSEQFGNRFLFTGREWLKDLRVYDYRNRIFQPELGRFLQPDPTGFEAGDYNLYRYCDNDPVNKSDPTGLVGLTGQGDGDWDWFNGGVAAAQIAAQSAERTETTGRSYGFIGLARATGAARAMKGEDATDSASVVPVSMPDVRMAPEEITKQPYSNVDYRTDSFTRKIPGIPTGYRNPFTGKIRVRLPVGIQSTLPNNTTYYDKAEAKQQTRARSSIYKADAAVKKLAAQGFHDVESAKRDVVAKYIEVIKRENTLNIIETDILQDWR